MKMKPIYVLGDHHGDYEHVLECAIRKGICNATLIHVGDGEEGFPWWTVDTAESLDRCFANLGIEYLSIRGNHSNPAMFNGSIMLPNFKLLPDYTRLEIENASWLFVGGAVSINRIDRKKGKTWWPDEIMVLHEELLAPADVLVTHAGPSWAGPALPSPFVDYYIQQEEEELGLGGTLRSELVAERKRHDALFELVSPKKWYLGHYHKSTTCTHNGCEVRILDCSEWAQH